MLYDGAADVDGADEIDGLMLGWLLGIDEGCSDGPLEGCVCKRERAAFQRN